MILLLLIPLLGGGGCLGRSRRHLLRDLAFRLARGIDRARFAFPTTSSLG